MGAYLRNIMIELDYRRMDKVGDVKEEVNGFKKLSIHSIHEPRTVNSFRHRLFKKDKKKLLKYATSTSTHGVQYIMVGKSRIRRILWSVLFVAALIACLYYITSSIVRYAVEIPTATTVSSVHVSYLEFPSVTICNLNPFNEQYITENNITDIVNSAIDLEVTNSANITDEIHEQCSRFKSPYSHKVSIRDLIKTGGQPLEDFIVDCHYLGVSCDLKNDFVSTFSPLSMCYTFNARDPVKVVQGSGYRHELSITLNVQQAKFMGSLNNEAGVRVTFQPPSQPPLPVNYGIVVPVGKSAYMGIKYLQIEDHSNIESSCIQSSEDYPFTILQGYNYSLSACLSECIFQDIVRTCNCLEQLPSGVYSNAQTCTAADLCCITASLIIAHECNCKLSCNHVQYDITTTYATFPSASRRDLMTQRYNTTADLLDQNFISLHMYFDELIKRKEVTVRSYDANSLIADIGGQMGLFLGASIISLTEFLVWLIDELKDRCFGINDKNIRKISIHNHKNHPDIYDNSNEDTTVVSDHDIASKFTDSI